MRGRVAITEVDGIPSEYASSARRYLGDEVARAYLSQIDQPVHPDGQERPSPDVGGFARLSDAPAQRPRGHLVNETGANTRDVDRA
jgi:hypothetical protein